MSYLRRGDKVLHYSDWSHRWLGGDGTPAGDALWRSRLDEHMARHEAEEEPIGVSQGRHRFEDHPD